MDASLCHGITVIVTVSLNMESYQQDQEGMSIGIAHYSIMANTELIPSNPKTSKATSIHEQITSIARNNKDASVSIEQYIQNIGLSQTAKNILLSSWRK